MNGRINKATWRNWADGIKSNLARPAFKKAWDRIKIGAGNSFEELRTLEQGGFVADPHKWAPLRKRLWQC